MTNQDLPKPEAVELHGEFAWLEWDRAVQEQDSGYLSLAPIKDELSNLSHRREFRAEVRA